MAVYFIFGTYMQELYLPDMATSSVFYGSTYISAGNVSEFGDECNANVQIVENNLNIADSFQPITRIYLEYDMESNLSEHIFIIEDRLISSSTLDHRINFNNMSTNEALDWMDGIAYGELMDLEEENAEDEQLNSLIDDTYQQMEMDELNLNFINLEFTPSNRHVSAYKFCVVCETYGHSESDH